MTHPLTPREKVAAAISEFVFQAHNGRLSGVELATDAILTALASGSGDHAELARLAEAATKGPWKSIIDDTGGERSGWPLCIVPEDDDNRSVVRTGGMWPYEWDAKVSRHEAVATAAFIAAANPATVLALLAEIAALNDYGRSVAKEALGYRDQATEAERKLAEADGLMIELADAPQPKDTGGRFFRAMSSINAYVARLNASKEAERG